LNADGARTARHEALHAVAATFLGWPVDAVTRLHTGGLHGQTFLSKSTPPGEPRDIALTKAIISLMPAVDDPTDETVSEDVDEVDILVRLSGIRLTSVWARCRHMLADPAFRAAVRRVEFELHTCTLLSGAEVRRLANGL